MLRIGKSADPARWPVRGWQAGAVLLLSGTGAYSLASECALPASRPETFELVIENGTIVDGTGRAGFKADIGIGSKRITAIGDLGSARARRRLNADGLVVAPGFIDMHSHSSFYYLVDSRALSKVSQGITLEVEGEGRSVAPVNDAMWNRLTPRLKQLGVEETWRSLDDFFTLLESQPGTLNFATYVGTENVREMVLGAKNRRATAEELAQMRRIVASAMQEGALGVYSALMYSPDRYNRTSELVEMARVAGRYGGVYQTHPRSESNAIEQALTEVETIAREANVRTHITHLKVAYVQNWGRMREVIDFIEGARARGTEITADIYPYTRAAGYVSSLLPPWVHEDGRELMIDRLRDPEVRREVKDQLAQPADGWENEYFGTAGGAKGIQLVHAMQNSWLEPYEGSSLHELAEAVEQDPRDALLNIVVHGDAQFTSLIMSSRDIRLAIQQPWVAFGTDGAAIAPNGPLSGGVPHPRTYGAFPKIFKKYVRELKLVALEEAVRRATSLPAEILGICDRGQLEAGYYADIVMFNPETIQDRATYARPHQLASGVDTVIVNGAVVFTAGAVTDARPGMVVRGPGYRDTEQ